MPYTFDDNNDVVLKDSFGTETSVTQSQSVVSQSMYLMGGNASGNAQFFKLTSDGTVVITGSISTNVVNASIGGNSQNIPVSSTLVAGSDGTLLRPLKVTNDGTLFITGSISTSSGTQEVRLIETTVTQSVTGTITINNPVTNLTANQGVSGSEYWKVTGSFEVLNFPSIQEITGSVTVNAPLSVTQGNAGIIPWLITGSITQNNFPITQSVKLVDVGTDVTQSVTGSIQADQGNPNSFEKAWPIVLTNNTISATILQPHTEVSESDSAVVVALSPNNIPKFTLADPLGHVFWGSPFGELRVANPYTLADLVNKYEIDPITYSSQSNSGGTTTFLSGASSIELSVASTSGSQIDLRTNTYFRYQAGKALRWRTTGFTETTGYANQVIQWGFFDDNDGLFFELNGTDLYIVQRSSVTGTPVDLKFHRDNWNYDKLNSSGPSGKTLDITKGNIYECTFQWLGVGNVYFFINGFLVHVIENPGQYSAPYMATGQLPLRWNVVNTNTSTASKFTYVCASVFVEGGDKPLETSFTAYNEEAKLIGYYETPILSIRPKLTYKGLENRMIVLPFEASVSTEGSRLGYRIVINSDLTNASWQSVDEYSGVEYDTSATSGSGGFTISRGFLPLTNDTRIINLTNYFSDKAFGRKLTVGAFNDFQNTITIYSINEGVGRTLVKTSIAWNEIR